MHYAVNLADLTVFAQESFHPVMLLLQPVLRDTVVDCEQAIRLHDVDPEQWGEIVELIRREIPEHQLRLYESVTEQAKVWRRV
jgi:hypothetical protein